MLFRSNQILGAGKQVADLGELAGKGYDIGKAGLLGSAAYKDAKTGKDVAATTGLLGAGGSSDGAGYLTKLFGSGMAHGGGVNPYGPTSDPLADEPASFHLTCPHLKHSGLIVEAFTVPPPIVAVTSSLQPVGLLVESSKFVTYNEPVPAAEPLQAIDSVALPQVDKLIAEPVCAATEPLA